MKKKLLPVLVAVILIIIIGGIAGAGALIEKYSYSRERVDPDEYFGSDGERAAVILQDTMVEDKALVRGGMCYFELGTVHKYFDETFYADPAEGLLLYTTPTDTVSAALGGSMRESSAGSEDLGYVIAFLEGETVYVAADYVRQFVNCTVDVYDRHVQVYTQWGERQTADIKKNTAVRVKGGVKSPILTDLEKGVRVEILEELDKWSKVKTEDAFIGYVENKFLGEKSSEAETPVTDVTPMEYTSIAMDGKVSLGFHSIGGTPGNATLENMVSGALGLKVIAPTWFSLSDNEGGIRSYASADYVDKAHAMGLKVWGVLDDFNYNKEANAGVEVYKVLSSTARRRTLVSNITGEALKYKLDGINIDFEKIGVDSGPHFIQFLRELSVQCRLNGLTLSVDNYVPFDFNDYYRLDLQGRIVDYVIIMGYDEHWHGSGKPGSVASIGYVQNGIAKTLEEVPAGKVINALPLYTILWKIDGAQVTDEYLTIANTADYLTRLGVDVIWDEETCQNYAEWMDGNVTYKLWVEDDQSIGVKLSVMSNSNIGGVAVWRLGYGNSMVWELINNYVNTP